MKFGVLDPRPIPVAESANSALLGPNTIGIEVTIPTLATRCGRGNIDPQHTGGDETKTAIEIACEQVESCFEGRPCCGGGWDSYYCPECDGGQQPSYSPERRWSDAVLVTVRPDLDSVGAMAVYSLAVQGKSLAPAMKRIQMVATADKFARGGYPGPKPLPTRDNPWDESSATAESSRPLAAIAAAVMDFKVPLADRVVTMEKWLLTGDEPAQYRPQVEKERLDMITAMEAGQIKSETRSDGRIAVVESTHRAATSVGYSLAPVVVALNPSFKQGPSEPYKKFTICAFEAKFADIKSALAELETLEAGWGGSPTIGGSPQGVSSVLTIDQVVEVVAKYLN